MTFTIGKERLTAVDPHGVPMGYVSYPQIRAGLVNVSEVVTFPGFRDQGVAEALLGALFAHLSQTGRKAALTCPLAQQYLETHSRWKSVLPDSIHFTTY